MPRKSTQSGARKGAKSASSSGGEIQESKSASAFFAEHQAIAGFDNMGKSLYTSIRELVENSLDACKCLENNFRFKGKPEPGVSYCLDNVTSRLALTLVFLYCNLFAFEGESIGVLPNIGVKVVELSQEEFNRRRGISSNHVITTAKDVSLFQNKASKKAGNAKKDGENGTAKNPRKKVSQTAYFDISVRDNGCGMKHDDIPHLLGQVLSGSKHGVRQTRGKFGLGAKMTLIWSAKTTNSPFRITTSHRPKAGSPIPREYSTCELDIDISKNRPKVIEHTKHNNQKRQWEGTELQILIAGNWTTYKSKIINYLQNLAIITPYAELELTYDNPSDPKRNLSMRYDRRSEQMPKPASAIKHHPSSVNNLIVLQLLERSNCKTWTKFLTTEMSGVSISVAKRVVAECGWGDDGDDLDENSSEVHITKLVQVLQSVKLFKAPDGSCLSPLGEYNLNLGIRKVLEPDIVATARDKPGAYEGHPFLVEAAVSLGGSRCKEGLTVFRFANRIPLLFEGSSDVSSRVALNKIKWSTYKMDYKRDKIGVFVSIVSTKIPYKGTSKEYIGDDIVELSNSVKRAIQSCCQQLRTQLTKRNALRDQQQRKSRLSKYIPDVTRSLHALLESMTKRHREQIDESDQGQPSKKLRKDPALLKAVTSQLDEGKLTEEVIKERLEQAVQDEHDREEEEGQHKENNNDDAPQFLKKGGKDRVVPLYLIPLFHLDNYEGDVGNAGDAEGGNEKSFFRNDIQHPLFTFRPIKPVV